MVNSIIALILILFVLTNYREDCVSIIQSIIVSCIGTGMIGSADPYRRHLAAAFHSVLVLFCLLQMPLIVIQYYVG